MESDPFDCNAIKQESGPQGTVDYTYYANGQRETITPTGGTTVTYFYDAADRLTQLQQAAGTGGANPTTPQTVGFTYDTANRLTTLTLPNGIAQGYDLDNAGQVRSIAYNKANTSLIGNLDYSYSPVGNRLGATGSLARTGLPPALPDQQYDGNNRLTVSNGIAQAYNNNGALTNDGSHTYAWNNRDQLSSINGANSATFTYDAFGRRRSANVNGQVTVYLYDGWNPIQLKNGTGGVLENRLYGPGLDQIYARTRNGVTESFLTDALGSVVELRNGAQNKTVEYTYDPYGGTSASAASTNTVKYTAREQDLNDLYYYRNRYYKPSVGRFISEDPIGLAGGMNLYAYVNGNPVNLVDPEGFAPLEGPGTMRPGPTGDPISGPYRPKPTWGDKVGDFVFKQCLKKILKYSGLPPQIVFTKGIPAYIFLYITPSPLGCGEGELCEAQ